MVCVPQALLDWKQPCLLQLCQSREMLQRQHPEQRVNSFLMSRAPMQHHRRVVERWDMMDLSKMSQTRHGLIFGTTQPGVLWRVKWFKHWIPVAEAKGSRSWDFVAPQLLVWHLEARDERCFLTGNQDALSERRKEESLTSCCRSKLMKKVTFQANTWRTNLGTWPAAGSSEGCRDFHSLQLAVGIGLGRVDV